jgi:hypothetical protein
MEDVAMGGLPADFPAMQITHSGFRYRDDVLDFIVGFELFGSITNRSRAKFHWGASNEDGLQQVRALWTPTLQNAQGGFRPFRTRPFVFPHRFEVCDHDMIAPVDDSISGLYVGSIFLICFTIEQQPASLRIRGEITPEPAECGHA